MKTSPSGRAAIAAREGVVLTAYLDSVGVLTIGVGHTSAAGSPKVTKGMKITAEMADAILSNDLNAVEAQVSSTVKVPLNQNQFDALVSLCFNIGGGAFKGSTLVRKLNAGDVSGAADQFLVWNKGTVKGKKVVIDGLTVRRQAERRQFIRPMDATAPIQAIPAPAPAPEPVKVETPPVAGPKPSAGKTAAAAGVFAIIALTLATWWHEFAAWVSSLF